jgi:hypothetical protein
MRCPTRNRREYDDDPCGGLDAFVVLCSARNRREWGKGVLLFPHWFAGEVGSEFLEYLSVNF